MARKRKTLPKGFENLLKTSDLESLKAVFDTCGIDAYQGYNKASAIACDLCPDDLVRWLVEQGADLHRVDIYGETPLHNRASSRQGNIKILLELGSDVTINTERSGTPLHVAARYRRLHNSKLLLQFGAEINKKNSEGLTPLESALQECSNIDIEETLKIAEFLLESGAKQSSRAKVLVEEIGKTFEFHRSSFNKDYVDATSSALDRLYELFQVPPIHKRVLHDGKSEIIINEKTWQKQHEELWNMLVPSSGYAATVQGEVIRIAGRISDEIERNGGVNWDNSYKKMGQAYLQLVSTGESLSVEDISAANSILADVENSEVNTYHLAEYAVKWVNKNKTPIALLQPDYKR